MNPPSPLPAEAGLTINEFQQILHPLTEFVVDPHGVELFEGDLAPLPEPYRGLLVHENDMTSTLELYFRERPKLEVLAKKRSGTSLFRQVLLRGRQTNRVVEYGAIRIELDVLNAAARWAVLEGRRPLGGILGDHRVPFISRPESYFGLVPGRRLLDLFGVDEAPNLFGRKNFLTTPAGDLLAEVVEILPPIDAKP